MSAMSIRNGLERLSKYSLLPPKDKVFYAQCDQMAVLILAAADGLVELFATGPDAHGRRGEIDARITALEADGDKMVKLVLQYLGRVQQPPFNRDDLDDLIHQLDDILDLIKVSATVFIDRGVVEGDATMQSMARNLREACRNLAEAIGTLRKRINLEPYVDAVRKFERQSDAEFHSGFRRCTETVRHGDTQVELKLRALKGSLTEADHTAAPSAALLEQLYSVLEAVHEHSRQTALFSVLRDEYEAVEHANNSCRRAMVTLNRLVVSNG